MGAYASPTTPIADDRLALRVDDFHIHVNQMKQQNCSGFNEEFLSFHEGQTAPWEVGKRDENRVINNINALHFKSRIVYVAGAYYELTILLCNELAFLLLENDFQSWFKSKFIIVL